MSLEAQPKRPTVSRRTTVHADDIRRSVVTPARGLRDTLANGQTAMMILVGAALLAIFAPLYYVPAAILAGFYFVWFSSIRGRLPFRTPLGWPGPDYSQPHPGKPGEFLNSEGLLYLGIDQETGTELHITNSDARRHVFTLGTTGAGKALPLDARILTPQGWRRNGDLRVGDEIVRPDGSIGRVTGVFPQGRKEIFRVLFGDGRFVDCDKGHLWDVQIDETGATLDATLGATSGRASKESGAPKRLMETADLGIFTGVYPHIAVHVPLIRPPDAAERSREALRCLADPLIVDGPDALSVDADGHLRVRAASRETAIVIQDVFRRLGGVAVQVRRAGVVYVLARLPDLAARLRAALEAHHLPEGLRRLSDPKGLRVLSVEATGREEECSCIKVDNEDGLYVTGDHVVTHNTEVLLGLCAQPLMWSSGFLFVDGKGTPPFYARVFSLAKRFGRQDDVRVINFMGAEDSDAPSGGLRSQTNTMNPFAMGTADQLSNLLMALMGDAGQGGDMWKGRAAQLISSVIRVLVELRDNGDLQLDVQAIRDYLPLGVGMKKAAGAQPAATGRRQAAPAVTIDQIDEEALKDLARRPGLIELYLRSLKGEFSTSSRLALKGFFDSLPGFVLDKALKGEEQDSKTLEQYGYLSMQLTKPLGSLADDFGHIFRTPLGEVDMNDVVFQRRILIVLLPALQKAPDEIKNCGKIIVGMVKQMMGLASGDRIDGSKLQIIDSSATKSATPFIAVFDEIGYYMVDGMDIMMAQARSLNFCIIPAGQDLQAMKKGGSTVADSVTANARLTIVGATEDAKETRDFVVSKIGRAYVAAASGYQSHSGMMGSQYMDRMDVQFQEVDRVSLQELQGLQAGEFFMLFEGVVVRCQTFYIGEDYATRIRVNKFLKVRGPSDRAPSLDQTFEIGLREAWLACAAAISRAEAVIDPAQASDDGVSWAIAGVAQLRAAHPKAVVARPCVGEAAGALLAGAFGDDYGLERLSWGADFDRLDEETASSEGLDIGDIEEGEEGGGGFAIGARIAPSPAAEFSEGNLPSSGSPSAGFDDSPPSPFQEGGFPPRLTVGGVKPVATKKAEEKKPARQEIPQQLLPPLDGAATEEALNEIVRMLAAEPLQTFAPVQARPEEKAGLESRIGEAVKGALSTPETRDPSAKSDGADGALFPPRSKDFLVSKVARAARIFETGSHN